MFVYDKIICKKALLPTAPCNLNCDKAFPFLSDQYTIPKQDWNPPKQSEDYFQSTPLPPSHHGWVSTFSYYFIFSNGIIHDHLLL